MTAPALMKPAEAAEYLATTTATLAGWRFKGCGPAHVSVGKFVRYRRDDLDAFIEANTHSTNNAPRLRAVR